MTDTCPKCDWSTVVADKNNLNEDRFVHYCWRELGEPIVRAVTSDKDTPVPACIEFYHAQ